MKKNKIKILYQKKKNHQIFYKINMIYYLLGFIKLYQNQKENKLLKIQLYNFLLILLNYSIILY